MFFLLEIAEPAALEWMPMMESISLLLVAVLLVGAAVGLRTILTRWEKPKTKEKTVSLAGKHNG